MTSTTPDLFMNDVPGLYASSASHPAEHLAKLAESVADFVRRSGGIARVRELRGSGNEYDRGVWKQMAGLGWLGILVPEKYGGLGLGLSEAAVVAEGLARSVAPEPFTAAAVLATSALVQCENEVFKAAQLPRITAGDTTIALAWQEETGNLDCASVNTYAQPCGTGYTVTGVKKYLVGGAYADAFIVSARTAEGFALFWVPALSAGATLELEAAADERSFATLTLRNVHLAAEHCLARGIGATAALALALDYAAAIAGAELVGVMTRALAITLGYMRTRVAFGKPIGAFQALQHRVVDLYIQTQFSCAVMEEALWALDHNPDARTRAMLVSRVKARCSDAALRITREAIQLHGAMGFTDECDVGLYVKRALVLAAWLGHASHHRRRYMKLTVMGKA